MNVRAPCVGGSRVCPWVSLGVPGDSFLWWGFRMALAFGEGAPAGRLGPLRGERFWVGGCLRGWVVGVCALGGSSLRSQPPHSLQKWTTLVKGTPGTPWGTRNPSRSSIPTTGKKGSAPQAGTRAAPFGATQRSGTNLHNSTHQQGHPGTPQDTTGTPKGNQEPQRSPRGTPGARHHDREPTKWERPPPRESSGTPVRPTRPSPSTDEVTPYTHTTRTTLTPPQPHCRTITHCHQTPCHHEHRNLPHNNSATLPTTHCHANTDLCRKSPQQQHTQQQHQPAHTRPTQRHDRNHQPATLPTTHHRSNRPQRSTTMPETHTSKTPPQLTQTPHQEHIPRQHHHD